MWDAERKMITGEPTLRRWVHSVDDRLVLTWQVLDERGWRKGGIRDLTFAERVQWRMFKTTPMP